jgi:LysR family hydrogen peroxide-inducible transcriptional activator
MADVAREPFILLDPIHCLGDQVVSFCHDRDCRPAVRCTSSQLLTVQHLVAAGQGVSLVPRLAARADRSHRCHYRSLTAPAPKRQLVIARHRHRYLSPLAESFMHIAHGLPRT